MSQYADPEVLVDTAWVVAHRSDPNVRVVEVDVEGLRTLAIHYVFKTA